MGRILAFLYGLVSYAISSATILYAIGFVAGVAVPKTIDSGPVGGLVPSLLIDTALLGVFALQHSIMARPSFKAWWTRFVPEAIERSTYVLLASLALILLFWEWRPLPSPIWLVSSPAGATVLWVLCGFGWLTVLTSTFLINHFDLFGLRQVWAYASGREIPPEEFVTPLFYRVVRHPLYLGFMVAFWATPLMSLGHLYFAFATTAFVLIAIQLEEHDMVALFGDTYRRYQRQVSMILPWIPRSGA